MKLVELIQSFFSPLGFIWMVLIITAIMSFRKKQKFMGTIATLSAVMLTLVGNNQFAEKYLADMEKTYQGSHLKSNDDLTDLDQSDAVVVLNWASKTDIKGSQPLSYVSAGERLLIGAELTSIGKAKFLIVPDANMNAWSKNETDSNRNEFIFEKFDLQKRQVVKIPASEEIYTQATHVAKIARVNSWKTIHLVTDAVEMDRAAAVFANLGIEVIPVACDFKSGSQSTEEKMNIVPSSEAVDIFSTVMGEKMKTRRYRMKGWI